MACIRTASMTTMVIMTMPRTAMTATIMARIIMVGIVTDTVILTATDIPTAMAGTTMIMPKEHPLAVWRLRLP